jgi:hypothetical protein
VRSRRRWLLPATAAAGAGGSHRRGAALPGPGENTASIPSRCLRVEQGPAWLQPCASTWRVPMTPGRCCDKSTTRKWASSLTPTPRLRPLPVRRAPGHRDHFSRHGSPPGVQTWVSLNSTRSGVRRLISTAGAAPALTAPRTAADPVCRESQAQTSRLQRAGPGYELTE